ncbi:MAG: 2-amino-4-hydroxy-6-hydroxymethyldihydropteridine diphosphokinase [Desulfomicrobium escambiense]|nr:2-amino-4-hydroxy-6-hydroxymethyldihydropteridine diphosphokinase [Desulfomicrobium escambiense]
MEKPWGHELIWAETDLYVGKILREGRRGRSRSGCTRSRTRRCTSSPGRSRLWVGPSPDAMVKVGLARGEVRPDSARATVHKIVALTDAGVLEASTPRHLQDVVRFQGPLRARPGRVVRPAGPRRRWVFALGSNLGDPLSVLRAAAARLASGLGRPEVVSGGLPDTSGGGAPRPPYLNAVLVGDGPLDPRGGAGARRGRRSAPRGAARPTWGRPAPWTWTCSRCVGDAVVDTPSLRIPHPRWRTRDFVVRPLLDVAPDLRDPETGDRVRDVALRAAGWGPGAVPALVVERGGLLSPEEGA